MGHSTAYIEVEARLLPEHPSASKIMEAAIAWWHAEEAERWDDARPETPRIFPLSPYSRAEMLAYVGQNASRIIPFTHAVKEKTSNVVVEVTASELQQLRKGFTPRLDERFGENAVQATPISLPKVRAPRAQATEGKIMTVYVLGSRDYSRGLPREEFPSLAAARAAGVEHMKANPDCGALEVKAVTKREGASTNALLVIERPEPELTKVTFKVTTQVIAPKAKIDGYLVTFDYHH